MQDFAPKFLSFSFSSYRPPILISEFDCCCHTLNLPVFVIKIIVYNDLLIFLSLLEAISGTNDTNDNSDIEIGSNLSGSPFCESPNAFSNYSQSQSSQEEEELPEYPENSDESGNEYDESLNNGEQDEMFTMDNDDEVSVD